MRGAKVTSPEQTPEAETPPALPGKTASNQASSAQNDKQKPSESGENTPRRPSSPVSHPLTRLSLEDKEGFAGAKPSIDTIRGLHDEAAHDKPGSGAATPRAPADGDETQQHHHLSRRLSTGAFLGNASLRGMQEDRRREILGLPEGEDAFADEHNDAFVDATEQPPAASESRTGVQGLVDRLSPWSTTANDTADKSTSSPRKSRIVEPHRNPEEDEFGGGEGESENGRNDDDDDEEEDEEELAEAERLAEESMQRSKENQAAGVEKVR